MDQAETAANTVGLAERLLVLFGGMAAALTVMGLATVLPQIDTALAHSAGDHTMVRLLTPISGLAMVAGAPMAGFMVDRYGVRRFLFVNCLAYVLLGTVGLWASDLRVLFASRLLLGLFAAAITTTAMIVVNTRMTGGMRAKWTGLHIAVATLCSLALFPVLGALGEIGWRAPFLSYALIGGGLAILALFIRDPGSAAVARTEKATAKPAPAGWFPVGFALLALVIGGLNMLPAVYMAFLVKQAVGHSLAGAHSSASTAAVMMGGSVFSAIASFQFGRLARALDWRRIFVLSFLCFASSFTVLSLAQTLPVIALGAVLSGGGIGWSVANLFSASAQAADPALQSRVTGVIKGAQYIAAPLAVAAIEPVARAFGPQGAFGMAALVSWLMVVWFVALSAAARKAKPA